MIGKSGRQGKRPIGAAAGELGGSYPNPTLATTIANAHTFTGVITLENVLKLKVISQPSPAASHGFLWANDEGGVVEPYVMDSNGNTAGLIPA